MTRNTPSVDKVNRRQFNAFLDAVRSAVQTISPETDMFECRIGFVWQQNPDGIDTPLFHPFEEVGGSMLLCAVTPELQKKTLAKLKTFGYQNLSISDIALSDVLDVVQSLEERVLNSPVYLTIFYDDDLIPIGPDQLEALIGQLQKVRELRALTELITALDGNDVEGEIVRESVQAAKNCTVYVIVGVNPGAIQDPTTLNAAKFPPALLADRPHEGTADIFDSGGVVFGTEELALAYLTELDAPDLYSIRPVQLEDLLNAFTLIHDGDIDRNKGLEIHLSNEQPVRLSMETVIGLSEYVGRPGVVPRPPSLTN